MKKRFRILLIIIILLISTIIITNTVYTNTIDTNNNTLIISVCTGDMRGLEIGVSVYAGYKQTPLILSDKTLPNQLATWLPSYIKENNIEKIIVIGPITPNQLLELYTLGIPVQQINDNDIPSILTKIADNTDDKNNDTIIFTDSIPVSGVLGAYMKSPVFVTATNSTYTSSQNLDPKYKEYLKNHEIKHIIIVGSLPEPLKNELQGFNVSIEEITGETSLDISKKVNNKLINEGYVSNLSIAYYGFYGELPTIIPNVIKDNAILLQDSSNQGNISDYLKENNISTLYITRNTESDYIQMEEEDYISTTTINDIKRNNINITKLTRDRTLDEATGLYDMKIISLQAIKNKNNTINNSITSNQIFDSEPPLISILNKTSWKDSNNITVNISKINDTEFNVTWNTIHPYTWTKKDNNTYYVTSNGEYEYYWRKNGNNWYVDYKFNNKTYYTVDWIKNQNNSWTEIQNGTNYTWNYDGTNWYCYNNESKLVHRIDLIT